MFTLSRTNWDQCLHRAILANNTVQVERALRAGASLTTASPEGDLPLHAAVRRGFVPIVEQLMQAGADIMTPSRHGETAMEVALRQDHHNLVHWFAVLLSASAVGMAASLMR